MFVFRCQAGPNIGMGHLMRCRTLAHALYDLGELCVMVGPSLECSKEVDNNIFEDWIPVPGWDSSVQDAENLNKICKKYSNPFAILDHYRIDKLYQQTLRCNGLHWLQFDGKADRPLWADVILNVRPDAPQLNYQKVIRHPDPILLLGSKFVLIRQEFLKCTSIFPKNSKKKILIIFGGADDRGAILLVLESLLTSLTENVCFLVVIGSQNPRKSFIIQWIKEKNSERIQHFTDPSDLPDIMASSDMAICSGGGVLPELAFFHVPMIVIPIAGNQIEHAQAWEDIGEALNLGHISSLKIHDLVKAVKSQMLNCSRGKRNKLIDGEGVNRVAQILLKIQS